MNWKNSGLLALILMLVLAATSDARGGRGGGWGGGSRSGGGGGWLSGLFGGSSSKKKTSSSLSLSSPSSSSSSSYSSNRAPVYNSKNHRTSNTGSSFDSVLARNSDLNDFLNGYMVGNLFSRDSHYRLPEEYPRRYPTMHTSAERAGNSHSRHLFVDSNNNQPEITTNEEMVNKSESFDIFNEFNKPFDENESMTSFFDRILKVDFNRLMRETSEKVAELNRRTDEKYKTKGKSVEETTIKATDTWFPTELPSAPVQSIGFGDNSTTEVMISPGPGAETSPPIVAVSSVTSLPESLVVDTESTLESRPDVSAPYGVICAPMLYNEINEFGVNATIERVACYPAPEPIVEGAPVNVHD